MDRDFIRERQAVLVANEMRTGKTPLVVSSHDEDAGPLYIVCPIYTRHVWLHWLRQRWPGKVAPTLNEIRRLRRNGSGRISVLEGETFDRGAFKDADIILAHYEILPSWVQLQIRYGTLVFDEPHQYLASRKPKRTQAARLLATVAKRIVAVTGTPQWNRPVSMYPLLRLLVGGAFGSYTEFTQRYAGGRMGEYGWIADGLTNEDELRTRLSTLMVRRTWEEVAKLRGYPDLKRIPPKVEIVEISPHDKIQLDKALYAMREPGKIVTKVGDEARFRRLLARYKRKHTLAYVKQLLASGEPVVVWTWHVEACEDLAEALNGFSLHGEMTRVQREKSLAAWRASGATALVVNLAVGQSGIDLSHAKHAVFMELDWTPVVLSQAMMRTFRPERPNYVTLIITDHPVEVRVVKAILQKFALAERSGVPASESDLSVLEEAFCDFDEDPIEALMSLLGEDWDDA